MLNIDESFPELKVWSITLERYYNLWEIADEMDTSNEAINIRNETSVSWYEPDQFIALFKNFVRAGPNTYLKDFIALFRGFTESKKM